jgi:signal transduction histidine kinase
MTTEADDLALLRRRLAAAEAQAARAALIERVARLIASGRDTAELFAAAVAAVRESFGLSYVAAGVVDQDDPETLVLLVDTGADLLRAPVGYRQSIHEGLLGRAARERRAILVNDVRADSSYLPVLGSPAIVAELAVPILVGERLLGVINVEAERPISEAEVLGIGLVADQIGAALDNARLIIGLQRALETTRLLFEVSRSLGAAMSVEEVIASYLGEVGARGPFICTVALYERDVHDHLHTVAVQGYWTAATGVRMEPRRVPHDHDDLDELLDAGETITINDVRSDPRVAESLRRHQSQSGRPALAFIPLLARGRRLGLVILSHDRAYEWPATELRLYQTTASQLASAIDSRLQHEVAAERAQQVALLEERRRLARELHDSVTQSLFSMSLLTQVLPDLWKLDRDEAARSMEQIRDLTRGALAEMRELLFELRPAEVGEQNLAQAMRTRAAAFQRRTGLTAQVEAPSALPLPADQAQALLRIMQEGLTNINRHARANTVRLELSPGPPLALRISDDGRGFDPASVEAGRLGLLSMRERAAAIGATLDLRSAPGAGTAITVTLLEG